MSMGIYSTFSNQRALLSGQMECLNKMDSHPPTYALFKETTRDCSVYQNPLPPAFSWIQPGLRHINPVTNQLSSAWHPKLTASVPGIHLVGINQTDRDTQVPYELDDDSAIGIGELDASLGLVVDFLIGSEIKTIILSCLGLEQRFHASSY